MSILFLLAIAASAGAGLFRWFVRLERAGKSPSVVFFLLWLLVIESALYPNTNSVPAGLFHPGFGPDPNPSDEIIESAVSFRLPDLVIPIALGARLYAKGAPQRIRFGSLAWVAFFTWLVASAVAGFYYGNSTTLIAFEGKAVLYLGALALAAGIPFREYTQGPSLDRLIRFSAVTAAILIVLDELDLGLSVDVPLMRIPAFGNVGADAATLFVALGIIALAGGACKEKHRFRQLAAAGPLFLASVVAEQRAALLGLGISLLVLALLAPFARHRLRTTPTELGLAMLLVLGLFLIPTLTRLVTVTPRSAVPFSANIQDTFQSREKQLSAEARVNQWRKAKALIAERPITGWGLGKTYRHYDPGHREFFETNYTHNIATDLLLRTGVIGLFLFAAALLVSLWEGWAAWRRHFDDIAAAFGLACVAIIAGLVTKGMVESIFEKFRLATLLGVVLGIVGSVAVSAVRSPATRPLRPEEALGWSSQT